VKLHVSFSFAQKAYPAGPALGGVIGADGDVWAVMSGVGVDIVVPEAEGVGDDGVMIDAEDVDIDVAVVGAMVGLAGNGAVGTGVVGLRAGWFLLPLPL
jgi:putative protein kinase ArgK-like GTPase of G3E family